MKLIVTFLLFLCNLYAISNLEKANRALEKKSYKQAHYFYKQALNDEQDKAKAYFKLGTLYYQGLGVKKSYHKTYRMFTKASLMGYEKATYNLGIFYSSKRNPYFDLNKGYSIFKELANQGHAGAQNRIGMFLLYGFGNVVEKDYKMAVKWFEHSSKQGYDMAHCNLAFAYASGKGVWQNLGRAHAFAKAGYKKGIRTCVKVWKDFNLHKYPEDKGWKFKFYNKPKED